MPPLSLVVSKCSCNSLIAGPQDSTGNDLQENLFFTPTNLHLVNEGAFIVLMTVVSW